MSRHLRFLQLAAFAAAQSDCPFKHGALIVRGGAVLASSPNKHRNPPAISYAGSSVHAESAALRRTNAAGATLYVTRIAPSGIAMSRPCTRCWTAIERAGVKTVVYTTSSGFEVERVAAGTAVRLSETSANAGMTKSPHAPSDAVQSYARGL